MRRGGAEYDDNVVFCIGRVLFHYCSTMSHGNAFKEVPSVSVVLKKWSGRRRRAPGHLRQLQLTILYQPTNLPLAAATMLLMSALRHVQHECPSSSTYPQIWQLLVGPSPFVSPWLSAFGVQDLVVSQSTCNFGTSSRTPQTRGLVAEVACDQLYHQFYVWSGSNVHVQMLSLESPPV